jgi:hypothetical protein
MIAFLKKINFSFFDLLYEFDGKSVASHSVKNLTLCGFVGLKEQPYPKNPCQSPHPSTKKFAPDQAIC